MGIVRASFAEMAVVLFEHAAKSARLNELGEELMAKANSPALDRLHAERIREAAILGQAHLLLKAMADHEEKIREMLIVESKRLSRARYAARFWSRLTTLEGDRLRRIA